MHTSRPVILEEWKSKMTGENEHSLSIPSNETLNSESWLLEDVKKILSSVELIAIDMIEGFSEVALSIMN